jgi:hypothetical protein
MIVGLISSFKAFFSSSKAPLNSLIASSVKAYPFAVSIK